MKKVIWIVRVKKEGWIGEEEVFLLVIRRRPRSKQGRSSAASDVYKGQVLMRAGPWLLPRID